jgi:AraC family transcriptional regulator of adaptative response / DNA-3-methyladenine glycosylase II
VLDTFDHCYRAVQSRDPRFDGWFVTAVTSTGIYCRPSCPARTPRPDNVRFYPSAAAAQHAGFRACKRCRPDASPGSPEWDARADVVARAMRLIGDGLVDREGVAGLARAVGYSSRQLERLLRAELGAGPLALARAQRAQLARTLIETTALPMAQVAFGAGFASVRQFNDTVRDVFGSTPTGLRRRVSPGGPPPGGPAALELRLPHRRPLAAGPLFSHLAATAVPGVEEVRGAAFRRTLRLPHGPGTTTLVPRPDHVACRLALTDVRDLGTAVARCRRLLDLDADPEAVDAHLAADPALAPLVASGPGRRVPRSVDGPELAVRVVLGQQVSLAGARAAAARLVARCGEGVDDPAGGLTHLFPRPEDVDLPPGGMPASRHRTVALAGLPGIGPWSVEMVALRGLGDPDAFPAGDRGVQRGAAALGLPTDPRALTAHAERWRPWRAYAVAALWVAGGADTGPWPPHPSAAVHPVPAATRAPGAPAGPAPVPDPLPPSTPPADPSPIPRGAPS